MSTISNSNRPDEGPPSVPPDIVTAPTVIPPLSPARCESVGVGPDRNALGSDALEASWPLPYNHKLRSYKSTKESPNPLVELAADIKKFVHSCGPSLSPGPKHESSPACTIFEGDQLTFIEPASAAAIDMDCESAASTPRSVQPSLVSQLPIQLPSHTPSVTTISESRESIPNLPSHEPTPAPLQPIPSISEAAQIARTMYECTLSSAFESLGKGFAFLMPFPEREAITKVLPDIFSCFQTELHRCIKTVEGRPIPLAPSECEVWSEVFIAAHSFASELLHYLKRMGLLNIPDSTQPSPIALSPPTIPFPPLPHSFSTDKLIGTANAIQAAVYAIQGKIITDSNALDIAHNLARVKLAGAVSAEACGSAAPSGALAAPCENLSDRAGHGTALAYMDAAPPSALGLSLGFTALDPYGAYGKPTVYDSFGQPPTTDPIQDPSSRAFSQISWAMSTAPPHETHPVEDSVPPTPAPAPVPIPLKSQLPSGPPEILEFTEVSWGKKGKNKGFSSSVQTPKKLFAAAASALLPVSRIQRELAKINKPSSAPAALPLGVLPVKPNQTKQKSPTPSGNLDLIIKVSSDSDRKLILSRANMPDSHRCLMCLVTHFNNLINSKEYRGKTSITPVQFSYGTNGNCYISFSPATKIEEVKLFRNALASCLGISGQFVILCSGKWTKLMISHVPVWRADPITGEEHHEVNTKNDLMMLPQLFVPNDLLDQFPIQDVCFLRPLDYVCRTEPGGHETIVLSVEDKSSKAFNAYNSHGLSFGYHNCYIRKFVDKVRLLECMRCSSYECKKPGNCNKPFVCNLCGGSHQTEVHNQHCPICLAQKLTSIPGHICRCPPKCPVCKKDHPFGDLECPMQGRYAPALANVLRMEGFTGSRTLAPVHHSPAASGMSARTPHPSTTAPGLINTEVSAPAPPDTSCEEDAEMAASC
ncbi:hypothetical protein CTheo_4583 [Ceratobasidium theobromae]|uniref:Uncharacterized protein n=1 Tax=Ceratobasidium theobromae TaxID=1582974 RepID=A0A5N5QL31_9AGAM|nr:hypothetical protein CTheo_4583 [Ceratobasidium theobromae]